jgi:hypothetical protein
MPIAQLGSFEKSIVIYFGDVLGTMLTHQRGGTISGAKW